MDPIGFHYIVEATGCNAESIADPDKMRGLLLSAAEAGEMEVKTSYFYRFSPTGISGVVIVAESHISLHTWPEHQYVALDVYVCGAGSNPEETVNFVLQALGSSHAHITEIQRGIRDEDVYTHAILTWEEHMGHEPR